VKKLGILRVTKHGARMDGGCGFAIRAAAMQAARSVSLRKK
jgi:hypothetical protein